jgi:low affinity Fe/Cu permease
MVELGSGGLSRALRRIDGLTSNAVTAVVLAVAVLTGITVIAATGFRQLWVNAFAVVAGGITLIMVFVIQHTQSREQTATQLKLDELIRALPSADDHLVRVEAAGDEELDELEQRHTEHHQSLRDSNG